MLRLTVKDFSCLKDVDMEISNLTVIIGDQATGKTLLGKILYYLLNVLTFRDISLSKKIDIKLQLTDVAKRLFLAYFPSGAWGDKEFVIALKKDGIELIKIERYKDSEHNLGYIEELKVSFLQNILDELSEAQRLFQDKINGAFSQLLIDFFEELQIKETIIANNKLLSTLNTDIKNILNSDLTNRFDDGEITLKEGFDDFLQGKLYLKKRNIFPDNKPSYDYYIIHKDGRIIDLEMASSGQQSLAPLLVYLSKIDCDMTIIDEPELHLFPNTQGQLIKKIVGFSNRKPENKPEHINRTFITTHSPYVLSQLSSLMRAGMIAEQFKDNEEKLNAIRKIIPEECWLPREKINIYSIKGGIVSSAIDEKGYIDEEFLSGISDDIYKEITALSDIEYGDIIP